MWVIQPVETGHFGKNSGWGDEGFELNDMAVQLVDFRNQWLTQYTEYTDHVELNNVLAEQIKNSCQKERLRELYDGILISVTSSVLFTAIIFFQYGLNGHEDLLVVRWILLVWGIAALRVLDAFLFFRQVNALCAHYKYYYFRFAVGSVLTAAAWGVLFWNLLPATHLDHQNFIILVAIGIMSFATISLSYHLGIFFVFQMIIMLPVEVRIVQGSHDIFSELAYLLPVFFLFQGYCANRLFKKYCNNIMLQHKNKAKEKQYKNLQFAVDQHAIVSITDVQGNIIHANNKMAEITGYTQEELLGQNHRIVKSNEQSKDYWENMWRTIAGGEVWHGEIRNLSRDKTLYWVDSTIVPFMKEDGKPYQYISIRTDITRLKQLEQQSINDRNDALIRARVSEILQGQSSLRERVAMSLDAISKADGLQIQNKLGVFLLPEGGQELEMFVTHGKYTEEFLHREKCVKLGACLCGRAAVSGKLTISDDCHTDPDHEHRFENMVSHGHYIVPLDHDGKILGILFMYTDPYPSREQSRLDTLKFIGGLFGLAIANEQVKKKLELARNNAEAMAQAKSDFLANMSHEIRTPMNGVLGMLELLSDMDLDDKSKGYVDIAHGSANMLLNVINDILDISKIESGKLHIEKIDFDLRKSVEDTADLLSKLAHRKNLELSCFIPPETKTFLRGDVMRLQQVLSNLISNAIKFTPQGDVGITVSTTEESADEVRLRFEIKDTGIGIPPEKHEKLFQAFTQADTSTSRKFGGTGLGLTICKKLVEMMGGEIGLTSQVGQGSVFWFELPFTVISRDSESPFTLNGLRILVIDDNETNCLILKKYLENWGAETVTAITPEIGLYRLQESIEQNRPFDILLLDMQMPGVTGHEVSSRIRNDPVFNELKIIILSSISLDHGLPDQKYFDLMLNKPIRQALLHDAIATVQNLQLRSIRKAEADKQQIAKLSGRVLFVDDNQVNQHLGRGMLEKLGLGFHVVTNGQEAVDARKNASFDLVLMDCQMPVMDGFEATRLIRQYEHEAGLKRITIVALTANAMEGDREKCLAAGMDDYLSKPYTVKELFTVLSQWLSRQPVEKSEASPETPGSDKEPRIENEAEVLLINHDKFVETKEMMGDSLNLIIEAFIESGESNLSEMKKHVATGNIEALGYAAHALKGSCAVLGMQRLFESCKNTEENCRAGTIQDMENSVEEIDRLFEDSRSAVQLLLKEEED